MGWNDRGTESAALSLLENITKSTVTHEKGLVFPVPTLGCRKHRYIPVAKQYFHISFTNELCRLSVCNENQLSLEQSIIMNKLNFSYFCLETPALPLQLIIRLSNDPLKQKRSYCTPFDDIPYNDSEETVCHCNSALHIFCAYVLWSDENSFITLSAEVKTILLS